MRMPPEPALDAGDQPFCHAAVQKNMNDEQRANPDPGGFVKKAANAIGKHQHQIDDAHCDIDQQFQKGSVFHGNAPVVLLRIYPEYESLTTRLSADKAGFNCG